MKSTFNVSGEHHGDGPNDKSFEIVVCFNGVPDTVILEVQEITGWSGASDEPSYPNKVTRMRAPLKASHARAIASALLSAATEVRT